MKTFYINSKGGLGFNIALARFIKALNKEEYKVKVLSPYWDVFKAAEIDYYKPEEIRDFIFDAKAEDAEIVEHRLYDMSDFICKKLNYLDAWEKLLRVEPVDEEKYNSLDLNVEKHFPQLQTTVNDLLSKVNKFILIQISGGQSPIGFDEKKPYSTENEPLKRAYPVDKAQKFVDEYKKLHGDVAVIQYCLPNEPKLKNCIQITTPYLSYYLLAKSNKCIGAVTIDSSLQHLITGCTKLVVLYGHSLPEHFGYSCNTNIIQPCRRDDILYFTALGASGAKVNYIEPEDLLEKVEEAFK